MDPVGSAETTLLSHSMSLPIYSFGFEESGLSSWRAGAAAAHESDIEPRFGDGADYIVQPLSRCSTVTVGPKWLMTVMCGSKRAHQWPSRTFMSIVRQPGAHFFKRQDDFLDNPILSLLIVKLIHSVHQNFLARIL